VMSTTLREDYQDEYGEWRCYFCRWPLADGHATYCPEWEEWDIEQARLRDDDEDDRG